MQINTTFIRYLFVGAINTVFGYSFFALLIFAGLHYSIALFFATLIGVVFNFKTFGVFVFGNNESRLIWRFLAIYMILYITNVFLVFIFLFFMSNVYTANALSIIFIATLGYFLNRRFVYEKN